MSVLIKGMDMPESCNKCRISFGLGRGELLCQLCCDPNPAAEGGEFWRECGEGADEKRPEWCPLVKVPTPHGQLIDVDEALKRLPENYDKHDLMYVIAAAPTIIDADG